MTISRTSDGKAHTEELCMKSMVKNAAARSNRGFSRSIRMLMIGIAVSLAFPVDAVMKTYNQYGFTEVQNIEMDGLSSSTEITATPQLAFPGVTLDDIHQCTFISELYGGGVDNRATAWGVYPKRHETDGSYDKIKLNIAGLTADERQIILDGCLMNYYAERMKEND